MSGQINTSTLLDNTVLSVELKNTKKNNALSLKMLDQMLVLFNQKNLTKKYKAIVIRGFKDNIFSSGADLEEVKRLKSQNNLKIYHDKLNEILKLLNNLNILTISVINSYCIGAGFILAINCNICICSTSCIFSIPASKLGISLPNYQLQLLKKKYPKNELLKEVILTGRTFSCIEAYNFNILNLVIDKKKFKNNYMKYLENLVNTDNVTYKYYYKNLFGK